MDNNRIDCVVIGYNETPFEQYESLLRKYGEESEAYRDLKLSFVDLQGHRLDYMGLLNHVLDQARLNGGSSHENQWLKACDIPNLAAAYLTHYLRRREFKTRCINLFQFEKETLARYLADGALCVAITTTFYLTNLPVNEIVRFIRENSKDTRIIVGGPLIANHARNCRNGELEAALNDIKADIYVVESQGEFTLAKAVAFLVKGGQLEEIPNIIFFENGEMRRTDTRPENNSLDEEFIDWGLLADAGVGPTIQTRTARSCAFSCSFCNYPTRAGKLTLAELSTVEKELDSMARLNVKNVVFIDDTFNVPLPRFKDICRLMIERRYGFNWFSYFRCSNSDEESIALMAKSGCKGVFLGIESGSATILKNMNKAASVEKYEKGIKMLRQHRIMTFASLIIGFPGETEDTVRETVDFIKTNKPDYYRAQLWYCEPGTPIEARREQYRIRGNGFVWSHSTMDSLEAIDHIDRMFLNVNGSVWLPQWSFDFWALPYLFGRGFSDIELKELMISAQKLLRLEIASLRQEEKRIWQQSILATMVEVVRHSPSLLRIMESLPRPASYS